jgi:hypothetical protein
MSSLHVIGVDLANVHREVGDRLEHQVTLASGDPVSPAVPRVAS